VKTAPVSVQRNPGIDLLRGLSSVLVAIHHTALRIPLETGALGDWLPQRFLYGIQYDASSRCSCFS
jgi:peptidoglycan/LPS O-acetylase OafA/YrhL